MFLDVLHSPEDIPAVLRTARAVLAADTTAHRLDVLGAEQRIDTMAGLVAYRVVTGAGEVSLSTLLLEVNLQHGGTWRQGENSRVFTDAPSQLTEQALHSAVLLPMFDQHGLAA